MDTTAALPGVDEMLAATTRYLAALTQLDDESVREPSELPGWSRAHVVAHVSRNADAFERVIGQAGAGEDASMYDAAGSRDFDIEETARLKDLAHLVEDAQRSARRLERACRSWGADLDTPYRRVPGDAQTWPMAGIGFRRRAEVEIHHSDLDLGYLPRDWPPDFSTAMVRQRHEELHARPEGSPSMVLVGTDVEQRWAFGQGPGPDVRGTVGDLAWWLVGRGGGAGLTCSVDRLPTLGGWR